MCTTIDRDVLNKTELQFCTFFSFLIFIFTSTISYIITLHFASLYNTLLSIRVREDPVIQGLISLDLLLSKLIIAKFCSIHNNGVNGVFTNWVCVSTYIQKCSLFQKRCCCKLFLLVTNTTFFER